MLSSLRQVTVSPAETESVDGENEKLLITTVLDGLSPGGGLLLFEPEPYPSSPHPASNIIDKIRTGNIDKASFVLKESMMSLL